MTPKTAIKRLRTILETLRKVHGVRLDFTTDLMDIETAYGEALACRERIVRESQFNTYLQNPEYTKTMLIVEAMRLFLREIAPKRKPKRVAEGRVDEFAPLVAAAAEVVGPAVVRAGAELAASAAVNYAAGKVADKLSAKKNAPVAADDAGELGLDEADIIQAIDEESEKYGQDDVAEAEGTDMSGTMKESKQNERTVLAQQVAALKEQLAAVKAAKASKIAEKAASPAPVAETAAPKKLNIATLLEDAMEHAAVLLAAQGIGEELGKIAKSLADMKGGDLMDLTTKMKAEFDIQKAESFRKVTDESLQQVLTAVVSAKDAIDNEVLKLSGKQVPQNDMAAAGAAPAAAPGAAAPGAAPAMGQDAAGMGGDLGGNDMGGDMAGMGGGDDDLMSNGRIDFPIHADGFGGAESAVGPEEEPLGRARKESRQPTGRMVEGKAADVKKKSADGVAVTGDLPVEIAAALQDFEYYVRERRLSIRESRERSLVRYRRLAESAKATGGLMVSLQTARKALDAYIAEHRNRLDRVASLNGLTMPAALQEAAKAKGLTEDQFRDHLIGYLSEARGKLAEDRYAEVVGKLAEAADRNPAAMAQWVANLAERQAVAGTPKFDTYQSFTRRLLDEARSNGVESDRMLDLIATLKGAEQDVAYVSALHEAVLQTGFAKAYQDGKFEVWEAVAPRLRKIEGDAVRLAEGILARAVRIVGEHRTEHGDLNTYGTDLLGQLDGRYQDVREGLEQALSRHLKAAK